MTSARCSESKVRNEHSTQISKQTLPCRLAKLFIPNFFKQKRCEPPETGTFAKILVNSAESHFSIAHSRNKHISQRNVHLSAVGVVISRPTKLELQIMGQVFSERVICSGELVRTLPSQEKWPDQNKLIVKCTTTQPRLQYSSCFTVI